MPGSCDPYERLDRAALVHGGVRLHDAVEVGFEIEHAPGLDTALQDVVEQLGDVAAHGRHAAAQANVAEDHRIDRDLNVVRGPDNCTSPTDCHTSSTGLPSISACRPDRCSIWVECRRCCVPSPSEVRWGCRS